MFEHRDVRVRRGRSSASTAGKSSRQDVGEIVMPARNGFGYFPRKESNPLAGEASGTKTRMSKLRAQRNLGR